MTSVEGDTKPERMTREEIMAERVARGLHPKMGSQSLAESRRILMTWTKADLVEFQIRDESDMLKALDRAVAAEQALREHRAQAFTVPKPDPKRPSQDPQLKAAFERWLHDHKGRALLAQEVFGAGWQAHAAVSLL